MEKRKEDPLLPNQFKTLLGNEQKQKLHSDVPPTHKFMHNQKLFETLFIIFSQVSKNIWVAFKGHVYPSWEDGWVKALTRMLPRGGSNLIGPSARKLTF